jgi:hypothetical protein
MDGAAIAIWIGGLCILSIAFIFASPALAYCSARTLWRLTRARYVAERLTLADRISCDRERLSFLPRVQSGRLELHFGANAAEWPPGVLTPEACVRSVRDEMKKRVAALVSVVIALILAWVALIVLNPGAARNLSLSLAGTASLSAGGQFLASLLFLSTLVLAHTFFPFSIRMWGANATQQLVTGAPISWVSLTTGRPAGQDDANVPDFVGSEETLSDIVRFRPLQRAVLGERHESVFANAYYRSATLFHLKRYDEAIADIAQYAEAQRRALGQNNPWALKIRYLRAVNLSLLGQWPEALEELNALAPVQAAVLGEAHPDTLRTRSVRVAACSALGRYGDVVNETDALAIDVERVLGPEDQYARANARFRAAALDALGWAQNPAAPTMQGFAPIPFSAIRATHRLLIPKWKQRELAFIAAAALLPLAFLVGGGFLLWPWLWGPSSQADSLTEPPDANPQRAITSVSALVSESSRLRGFAETETGQAPVPAASESPSWSMMAGSAGANVRSEPRTDAPLLVRLKAGSSLKVTGRIETSNYDWFHVALPDSRVGYVREDVVAAHADAPRESDVALANAAAPPVEAFAQSPPMTAGRAGANVRAAPRTDAPLLVRLDAGASLRVTGRMQTSGHDWFRVALPDRRSGFVREDVVAKGSQTPSVHDYAPASPMSAGPLGAKVRAAPSTDARLIAHLAAGTPLAVTGRAQASGHSWFRVLLPDNRWGFVRGDVVEHARGAAKQ